MRRFLRAGYRFHAELTNCSACRGMTVRLGVEYAVIGIDVGEAETEAFWRAFLRSLVARGLDGVRRAVSDAHEGLRKAIAQVLGCPWQRCTVHFLRDMEGHCAKSQRGLVKGAIREVFAAPDGAEARARLAAVAGGLEAGAPKVAGLLLGAEEELLAFMAFPREHWTKLRSTNPLERLNKEIARRSDVVGIYPNDESLIRLAGALLLEQNDFVARGAALPLARVDGLRAGR